MNITLSGIEVTVAQVALGCALDNEHDKGPDGCGQEVLEQVEDFLGKVAPNQPIPITLHTMALLQNYLGAIEGADQFDEEDDPAACEVARAALLAWIDAATDITIAAPARLPEADFLQGVVLAASGVTRYRAK